MEAYTSNYARKDGTRRRLYRCTHVRDSTGLCHAPSVPAEIVDAEILRNLPRLMLDFETWRDGLVAKASGVRDRMRAEVERAEQSYADAVTLHERAQARWLRLTSADDPAADDVLPMVRIAREQEERAATLLQSTRDALAGVETEPDHDALLDFANALHATIRGKLDPNATVAEINLALRELFAGFRLRTTTWGGAVTEAKGRTVVVYEDGEPAVAITPTLRPEVAWAVGQSVRELRDEVQECWPKMARTGRGRDDGKALRLTPWLSPLLDGRGSDLCETPTQFRPTRRSTPATPAARCLTTPRT
jgi:hypothetical protein